MRMWLFCCSFLFIIFFFPIQGKRRVQHARTDAPSFSRGGVREGKECVCQFLLYGMVVPRKDFRLELSEGREVGG